jgi:hypothetical protein
MPAEQPFEPWLVGITTALPSQTFRSMAQWGGDSHSGCQALKGHEREARRTKAQAAAPSPDRVLRD